MWAVGPGTAPDVTTPAAKGRRVHPATPRWRRPAPLHIAGAVGRNVLICSQVLGVKCQFDRQDHEPIHDCFMSGCRSSR